MRNHFELQYHKLEKLTLGNGCPEGCNTGGCCIFGGPKSGGLRAGAPGAPGPGVAPAAAAENTTFLLVIQSMRVIHTKNYKLKSRCIFRGFQKLSHLSALVAKNS